MASKATTPSPSPTILPLTSLEKLSEVEKRIVHAVEVTGRLMEELGNVSGVRREVVEKLADEFMKSMREVQVILRDEIRSMCDYRPFEHSDYGSRLSAEVSSQMLGCSLGRLNAMKGLIERYKRIPESPP